MLLPLDLADERDLPPPLFDFVPVDRDFDALDFDAPDFVAPPPFTLRDLRAVALALLPVDFVPADLLPDFVFVLLPALPDRFVVDPLLPPADDLRPPDLVALDLVELPDLDLLEEELFDLELRAPEPLFAPLPELLFADVEDVVRLEDFLADEELDVPDLRGFDAVRPRRALPDDFLPPDEDEVPPSFWSFASPASRRCLFTIRDATSSSRPL